MITVELELRKQKFDAELKVSGKNHFNTIEKSINKKKHQFQINGPQKIQIWLMPWKIKPLVRINGQLVDYGLAEITPYDHMLEFTIHENHLDFYFKNILESKRKYLNYDIKDNDKLLKKIGLFNPYEDIVKDIKENLK